MTETHLTEVDKSTEVAPYEPGLPFRDVVRGIVTRFLPGSLGVFIPIKIAQLIQSPDLVTHLAGDLFIGVGLPLLGFGLGLEVLRRWLYPDAEIEGRRSLIAGIATPLVLGVAYFLLPEIGRPQMLFLTALVGFLMALGTFFAWLYPTPKYKERYEVDQVTTGLSN